MNVSTLDVETKGRKSEVISVLNEKVYEHQSLQMNETLNMLKERAKILNAKEILGVKFMMVPSQDNPNVYFMLAYGTLIHSNFMD